MAGANPLGIIQGLLDVEETIGGFIKGDVGGDSSIANHFRDQYRARCEEFSNAPGWLQGFVGLGAGGAIARICKPYLDDNQWDSPVLEPPFTGGQCPVKYAVSYTTISPTFSGGDGGDVFTGGRECSDPDFNSAFGPIEGPRFVSTESDWSWGLECRDEFGNPRRIVSVGGVIPTGETIVDRGSMVITSLSACEGTDNCGDPDSEPAPGPNPAPMPDPIRLPDEEPRPNPRDPDALPDIPVDPFPDPIGGPNFPALPDGFGFGGGQSGGGGAGRSFDPIDNDDETGGQDEEFGEPPEGEVWVGAYLELTKVPINITNVPGTGPENAAYFRIVGNFSIFSDSNGARLYSDSITIKNQWTKFIGNPQGLPVSGARVSVLPGVRYRVIPVSAPADPDRNGEE